MIFHDVIRDKKGKITYALVEEWDEKQIYHIDGNYPYKIAFFKEKELNILLQFLNKRKTSFSFEEAEALKIIQKHLIEIK